MTRRVMIIGFCAGLLLAACSSDSNNGASSAEGKKYVAAMMAAKDDNAMRKDLTEEQARCAATNMIDIVGVDTLKKAGITPADFASNKADTKMEGKLSAEQGEKLVNFVMGGKCFDYIDVVRKSNGSAFGKLTKEQTRCFFDAILKLPKVKAAFIDQFTGGDSDIGDALSKEPKVLTIMGSCGISPGDLEG